MTDNSQDEGVMSFELNLRYNQLVNQRYRVTCEISEINANNDKLLKLLREAGEIRRAAEMETLKSVHFLTQKSQKKEKKEKKDTKKPTLTDTEPEDLLSLSAPSCCQTPLASPVRIETPDARAVDKIEAEVHRLNQEYKRLTSLHSYLSKEAVLVRAYASSEILIKFHCVSDPCNVQRHFISCPRDTLVDDIVAHLPEEWNLSLNSLFVGHQPDLPAFNQQGTRLKDLSKWMDYLELGGLVFVSDTQAGPSGTQTSSSEVSEAREGLPSTPPGELSEQETSRKRKESTGTVEEKASAVKIAAKKKRKIAPLRERKVTKERKARTKAKKV
ncbi:hypothetical protein CJU90_3193 [Yarrowia sp. C11]|nr:hypothetical protein CKK34_4641 [Yarrowia sp. E02]KAG5369693.1 hypothetical protein CJU90_3193 [Yarrowia sp. C11]